MSNVEKYIPVDIYSKYEFYNYNHAVEILSQSFTEEFEDLVAALREFSISVHEIEAGGGNESAIPPKFGKIFEPRGWKEIKITGDLIIKFYPRKGTSRGRFTDKPTDTQTIKNYIDGHNIDYVKNRVACDIEWNSKDQTFDRDIFAFRTYYECDIISIAIIITRSEALNSVFRALGVMSKYGASTTWMGKLLPRLDSRRHGGCPILAIGITPQCISDLEVNE